MESNACTGGGKSACCYYRDRPILPLSHAWWSGASGKDDLAESVDLLGVFQRARRARSDASRAIVDRSVAILACLSLDGEGPLEQHDAHNHK